MELISPEFGPDIRRYSPIRVDKVALVGNGSRRFDLSFFHAAYQRAFKVRCIPFRRFSAVTIF